MKRGKIAGILLSCLLAVSNSAAINAFAADEAVLETGTPAQITEAEDAALNETEAETEAEEIPTEAELMVEEPQEIPVVQSIAPGIRSVTVSLASSDSTRCGMIHETDGTASFLSDGEKLTGHFSITLDYLKGDLAGDGRVDASDAAGLLIAASAGGSGTVSADQFIANTYSNIANAFEATQIADINNDGVINASDAAEILIYSSRIGAGEKLKPLGCAQYYANEKGVLQTGWINDQADKLHANYDYTLSEGWTNLDGTTYYFSDEAKMQTGYLNLADQIYYLGQDGAMTTGWLDTNDGVFYFDVETGKQAFGAQAVDGVMYYFDQKGALGTGWIKDENGTRYADPKTGELAISWQTVDDQLRYFYEDGRMATGESVIGTSNYLFDENGLPQQGWKESENGKRFYKENGEMTVGLLEMEDGTHLFNSLGLMATGWAEYRGNKYYLDDDGVMQTGLVIMDGIKYHFDEDGVYNPITICLDAGHYAKYNHSPVVSTYWESDFTWKMHLYLKEALESYGIEVITTREDKEIDLGLRERGRCSKDCDLFLSVHSNACSDPSIDAPLACCQIDGATDELGQQLADLVAEVMETKQGGMIWKRRGVKEPDYDYYSVLRGAAEVGTPGVLLEHSYHTNYRSTMWLLDDNNIKRMAEAEAELLATYFDMK